MRFLVTGVKGQLGFDIQKELKKRGYSNDEILAIDREEMDITNKEEVDKIIGGFEPDVIFHCAAWTQVDKAEQMHDACTNVNVIGTKNITDASIKAGSELIYMSTDYVFDGTKDGIYTEEDDVNPMSVYGKTKYLGEEEVRRNPNHFITRISWVFGINGGNFIKTMLKLSDSHDTLNVVSDQIGSPTYTVDLAKLLVDMAHTDKYGTYNATNEGYISWAEFAEYIFKVNGKNVTVNHVSTEDYLKLTGVKQAYRPRNSRLSKDKLEANGFDRLPSWQSATERYSEELSKQKVLKK